MEDKIINSADIENADPEKKEDTVKLTENVKDKKRSKEDKSKKRDDKRAAEQYLKGLRDVHTAEDKLDALCRKFSEVLEENKSMQLVMKQLEKKMLLLLREKEQYQGERTKAVLTRKRLEGLCRELQKQNKAVKEECLLALREEEEKRKDVTTKFETTLAEITTLMNQSIERNTKMYEDNVEMNKKCKAVFEQMELREQHLRTVHQGMNSNLQRAYAELANVKKTALAEKQQLLFKLSEYQTQIHELQATEVGLRSQISLYTDKYDEFQNALTRSNKVYGEFNEEMEKMSKKILTLEKETILWKQKWEKSHVALLEMAADKQAKDKELATLSKKVSLLQDLCKMFQRERTSLLAQLREKTGLSECEIIAQAGTQEGSKPAKQTSETTGIHPTAQGTYRAVQMIMAEVSGIVSKQFYTDAPDQKDGAQNNVKKDVEESRAINNEPSESTDNGSKEESEKSNESVNQRPIEETEDKNEAVDDVVRVETDETDIVSTIADAISRTDEDEKIELGKETAESTTSSKDEEDRNSSFEIMDVSSVETRTERLTGDVESSSNRNKINTDAEEMQRFRDVINGLEPLGNAVKTAIEEQLELTNYIGGKAIGESKEEKTNIKADSDKTADPVGLEEKSKSTDACSNEFEADSIPMTVQQFDTNISSLETVNSNIETLAKDNDEKKSESVETPLSAKDDVSTEGPTETHLASNNAEEKTNSPTSAKNPKKKKK